MLGMGQSSLPPLLAAEPLSVQNEGVRITNARVRRRLLPRSIALTWRWNRDLRLRQFHARADGHGEQLVLAAPLASIVLDGRIGPVSKPVASGPDCGMDEPLP